MLDAAKDKKSEKLTPAKERLMLFKHGTVPWRLTPSTILETARSDLRTKQSNKDIKRARKAAKPAKYVGPKCRGYAFITKHVNAAKNDCDLLEIALSDSAPGLASEDVNTLALYSDREALNAALLLARSES